MRAQDAADLADHDLLAWQLFAQPGRYRLRLFWSLGVHHGDMFHRQVATEVLDHPWDRPRPRPHAVYRLDLAVSHQQQRLEVEESPDHRPRTAEPAAHLQIAQGVEEGQDATFRYTFVDRCLRRVERFALGSHLAEERNRHRHGLAVDDLDSQAFNRLRTDPRGFGGGRQLRTQVDGDAALVA